MLSEKCDAPASLFSYPFLISKEDKQHERILDDHSGVVLFLTGVYEGDRSVCGSYQGKIFLDENETAYPFMYYTPGQDGYGPFTDMTEPMPLSELKSQLGVNR